MAKLENAENPENGIDGDGVVTKSVEKSLSEIDEGLSSEMVVGGYNKDLPPKDDVCPICFDDFDVPCKTNCGHWFCSICILQYLKFSEELNHCMCPMCACSINMLIPESSVLIQPGEEVGKIIKEIKQYNHLRAGGWQWHGLVKKPLAILRLMRRIMREHLTAGLMRFMLIMMQWTGRGLGMLYDRLGLNFFPNGVRGIERLFEILGVILGIYLLIDYVWHHWGRLRARHQQ